MRIINWIKEHIIISTVMILLCLLVLLLLPLGIVQALFLAPAPFPWLIPDWDSDAVLSYVAGFETLLGTTILGIISFVQTKKANELSLKLAKDNNYLQKIAIQNYFPLIRIDGLVIERYDTLEKKYITSFSSSFAPGLYVYDSVSKHKREKRIAVLLCKPDDAKYQKILKFEIKNISDSVIKNVVLEKAQFSGVKSPAIKCIELEGNEKYNNLRVLLLPKESIEVELVIMLDDIARCKFWDYSNGKNLGCFDITLLFQNTTITDIVFHERVYITQSADLQQKIVYDEYSGG